MLLYVLTIIVFEVKFNEDIYEVVNDILVYQEVLTQPKNSNLIVSIENPVGIFTIGGVCDIEIAPVSYLNKNVKGIA